MRLGISFFLFIPILKRFTKILFIKEILFNMNSNLFDSSELNILVKVLKNFFFIFNEKKNRMFITNQFLAKDIL